MPRPPKTLQAAAVPGTPGELGQTGLDPVTEARLWLNPCWFAFRFNYLGKYYNRPLYGWIEKTYGLTRPEYTILFGLGLRDGVSASDLSVSYGYPKNTLSRAIHRLIARGMIRREARNGDRRSYLLRLTPRGRALYIKTLPEFVAMQDGMLAPLSAKERETLSVLLAKVVMGTFAKGDIEPGQRAP